MTMESVLALLRNGAGLCTHSGQVRPGCVFVALPGSRVDGARFIGDAVTRGASVIVHARGASVSPVDGVQFVAADSPAEMLGLLARAAFGTEERVPLVVGITGTNGKTTTAYLAAHVLREAGLRTGLMGTVSCTWPGQDIVASMTTPDCVELHRLVGLMTRDAVDALVMEISSHALDQNRIAGLPVEVGIFSNLTQDHLDYHKTMENYFQAKARLFLDPATGCRKGAVNMDDTYGCRLKDSRADLLGFGLDNDDADLRGHIVESGTWGMLLEMTRGTERWTLKTGLVGRHNASNLLAAQAAGLLLGLSVAQLASLAFATGAPGRLERVPNSRGLNVFIDYAHTPDALEKVSSALKAMGFARLLTVFGCGGDRDATKRPLMGEAVARHADVAVVTSDNPRTEDPETIIDQIEPGLKTARAVIRESDRAAAIHRALDLLQPGEALLIAGKGHEDYQIIGTEKRHFSDFEVVREYLA